MTGSIRRRLKLRWFRWATLKFAWITAKDYLICLYLRSLPAKTFFFEGESYHYFYHHYNRTWLSERSVEVPIIWRSVQQAQGKRILELGNVLRHYYPVSDHVVVDKYEQALGVINEDIADFSPTHKFDLIVSISTMEHVGWDETPREPTKVMRAFDNLVANCLKPGGNMVVSIPLGFNPVLDKAIREGELNFSAVYFLLRCSQDNRWVQVGFDQVKEVRYNDPFPWANAVAICVWRS